MSPSNKIRNKSGVTIIEAMVVIGILTTIILILLSIFIEHLRLTKVVQTIAELQNHRSITLIHLEDAVHSSIQFSNNAHINNKNYNGDSDTLILQLASIDSNNEVIADTYDYIVFEPDINDSSVLLMNRQADLASIRADLIDKVVTTNLSNISFDYNNSDPEFATSLYVQARLTESVLGKARIVPLNTFLSLKNL